VQSNWAFIMTEGLMNKRTDDKLLNRPTDDTFTIKGFNAWNKPAVERIEVHQNSHSRQFACMKLHM